MTPNIIRRLFGRLIKALPTVYFLMALVGFELVASLLLPTPSLDDMMSNLSQEELTAITQVYTIPYRALSLLVMLFILFKYKQPFKNIHTVKLFIVYYLLWIVRLFYDTFIRTDLPNAIGPKTMIFTTLGFLSIFVINRSYKNIELDKTFKLIVFLFALCVFGMLIRNPLFVLAASEIQGRTDGSIGLNTISTANLAMSLVMMIVFWFVDSNYQLSLKIKLLLALTLVVSLIVGLRASSRGPVISFLIVLYFYYFTKSKYKILSLTVIATCLLFIILFKDFVLDMVGYVSPVLQDRFMEEGGSALQRQNMAYEALNNFINYPIFGYAFGVMFEGSIGYPHNTVLEAFNGLGLIGGVLFLILIYHGVKASYYLLHCGVRNSWVCLLFMMRLVQSMFSGNFYNDEALCMLWVFVFLYYHDWKRKKTILKYAA
jgi:hypothetical protein